MSDSNQELLDVAKQCAREAGSLVLSMYQSGNFKHLQKSDESPVTCADIAAHELIEAYLSKHFPDIPIMSEEQEHLPFEKRQSWSDYWLVDPIDGTQEFVAKSGDFAVSIAYVRNNQPIIGVIYWPVKNICYFASFGEGAWKSDNGKTIAIQVRTFEQPAIDDITIAVSRVQPIETVMKRVSEERQYQIIKRGSCSLKACAIAEGVADMYLRVGITGEWDTGAAQCIVTEAGGKIVDLSFNALSYNEREQLSNPDFLILGDQDVDWPHIFQ